MAYGAIIGQTPTVQASAEMTSYNNDNTSSVITADNVQGAIDQLFTSVSNGKSQIASAITDMGVSTSANDSFAQMATNIGNIETGYDTSQVTATAATVRSGYKFVNSSGQLITGTIPSKGAQTYTPKTVSQTISSGQYLSGNQTIQGDGNLIASNIKSGVSIFGVSGNLKEGYKYKTASPNVGMWSTSDDSLKVTFSSSLSDLNNVVTIIGSFSSVTEKPGGVNSDFFDTMVSVVCDSHNSGEYKIFYDDGDGVRLQKTDTLTYSYLAGGTFRLFFNSFPFSKLPEEIFTSEFVIIYQ